MKIKMVGVYVHDPLAAFQFYVEILGFKELMYMPEMYLAIVSSPEQKDGPALLLEPNENPIAKTYQEALYKANIRVIVFGAEDIDAEYEKLKGRGVSFRKPPTKTEWGVEALFEDGFGNLIQIHK